MPEPAVSQGKRDFGFLIRIRNKRSPKAPDVEGQIELDGVRYDLAGWIKESKRGRKYLSLPAKRQSSESGLVNA